MMAMWAMLAIGQVPPDAGRILRETPPQPERVPAATLPPMLAPAPPHKAQPVAGGDARVQVTRFDFTGNSALSSETLRQAIAPWAGRSLNFGELMEAVEADEARYKQAGYFLAQGYLPPQKIRDGAIEIVISEGRLGEIRLEGESRVSPDVLYAYLDRLPRNEALVLPTLERQVLLINDLAGVHASLDLQAGDKPGITDVVLIQQAEELFTGRLDADNHGLPSTGVKRLSVTLNANSALHLGERVSFNLLTSENLRVTSYQLRGDLPVGGDGWRLVASASRAQYSLGGAFSSLQASGTAESLRVGASYPLIRSRGANVTAHVEADRSWLVDKYGAIDTTLEKETRGLTASLSGEWLDELIGGGATRLDLAWRTGRFDPGPAASASMRHRSDRLRPAASARPRLPFSVSRRLPATSACRSSLAGSRRAKLSTRRKSSCLAVLPRCPATPPMKPLAMRFMSRPNWRPRPMGSSHNPLITRRWLMSSLSMARSRRRS